MILGDYEDCLLGFDGVWTGGSVPMFQSGWLLQTSWYVINDEAGSRTPWNLDILITHYTPSHHRR